MSAALLATGAPLTVGSICIVVLAASLLIAFWRLLVGPTQADRVVALDAMTTTAAAMIGIYAMVTSDPMLIRVALALALVAFLATAGLASFIAMRGRP